MDEILENFVAAEMAAGRKKTEVMWLLCAITGHRPSTIWPWLSGQTKMPCAAREVCRVWMAATEAEREKFWPDAPKIKNRVTRQPV